MDTEKGGQAKTWHSLWEEVNKVRVSLWSVLQWTENHPGINQLKKQQRIGDLGQQIHKHHSFVPDGAEFSAETLRLIPSNQ